ncbi:MAG: ester cyclase [Rhodobacter sp.]|nr:ester cyclase [Rhodobacter sp.]
MKDFDPKFRDLPDYILGVTKEIWEDRRIHSLNDHYASDIVVRSPASVVVGNQGVIAATMATLHEFPDRMLLGEDVIWSGAPETGMLSSHRLISTATHSGAGVYGASTGKRLRYRILADCHVRDNRIDDEWLVRDQGAIVRQMGFEPRAYSADLIAREGGPEACVRPLTPETDRLGPYQGRGNDHAWGHKLAEILARIMSAELSTIAQDYDRACHLEYPGGVTEHGRDAADRFWIGLRASFPSATFSVDHKIGREDPTLPPRAAIRWSLWGKHDGWGVFGPPSGATVYVMGITHAEFGPRGLRREYTLYDETAIWKQILLQQG